MKDQNQLLKKCLNNDIPAIVFQGSDSCAVEILQAAEAIYKKKGCTEEFLKDFHDNVLGNFKEYQIQNSPRMKLPDLTAEEKDVQKIFQEEIIKSLPKEMQEFQQTLKQSGFTLTNEEIITHGNYKLNNNKDYCAIIGKNQEYEFAINHSKDSNQTSYFIFSNDHSYPERVGDKISFKACFSDIMYKHPLQHEKSNVLNHLIEKYEKSGYHEISKSIEQYSSNFENICSSSNFKYTIENVHIGNTNGRELKGDITISNSERQPISAVNNLRILDKTTGRTESLNLGGVDLCVQPQESINKLLSGNKVEITNNSGITNLVGLNKTVAGWGISIAKQTFTTADSSAGI